MPSPSLLRRDVPGRPDGLVLMLHGGRATGLTDVDDRSASWRRSRSMMDDIVDDLGRAGVGVWLLRYGRRGWNDVAGREPSPVPDARWALGEMRREHGDVPVVLLGHSMGGRAAVAVADEPGVVGVVALAPWLPLGEPVGALAGKRLVTAHGRRDKITSFRATRAYCAAAAEVAAGVTLLDMGRVGHYMFRRRSAWNDVARRHCLDQLGVALPA